MTRTRARWCRLTLVTGGLALVATVSLGASFASKASPPYVTAAKKATQARTAPQTKWYGPKSGPTCTPGKNIAYVSIGQDNPQGFLWGKYLQQAAAVCGWKVTVLDGKSSPAVQLAAAEQAVALNPDGIVVSADAKSLSQALSKATNLGIPVVGLHGSGLTGPQPKINLYTNITSNAREIGRAMVDWAVADSNGKARLIFLYDKLYSICREKRAGWLQAYRKCPTCKLLKDDNFPISDTTTRMGTEVASWIQKYGTPAYVVTVADYYLDFAVPALRTGGIKPSSYKLAGADGTMQAYNRIRQGNQYQVVTIPEPTAMQSWQAVDELNRAMHKLPPSKFVEPVHLVNKANVDRAGSKNNQYSPLNGYKQHYTKIWKG